MVAVPPSRVKRYSQKAFPPYRFIPGESPHPTEDPQGYRFGRQEEKPEILDPKHWTRCEIYLYGVDLYNNAYWWESHEAWEGLWKVALKDKTCRQFLQGLIKISAVFLKWNSRQHRGLRQHYQSGMELLQQVREIEPIFLGINLKSHLVHLEDHFAPVMKQPSPWPDPLKDYPYIILNFPES